MTADAGGAGVPRFDVVLRGYDRRQVDEHVARLQRVMSRMRADLEMARSQPIPVVAPQQGNFGGPGPGRPPGPPRPAPRPRPEQPDMIGSFTDRMQSILQAAEEEAAEIRNKARSAARAEAGSVRAELADLVHQRDAVLAELTRLRGQLEGMLGAPTARMAVPPRDGSPQDGRTGAPHPAPAGPPAGQERPRPAPANPNPAPRPAPAPAAGPSQNGSPAAAKPQPVPSPSGPPKPGAPNPGSGQAGGPAQGMQQAAPASKGVGPGATAGPNGSPQRTQQANGQQAGAPRGAAADGPTKNPDARPSGPGSPKPAPAARPGESDEAAKAAHRLPTGAYPAVGEQSSSMRPRTDPEPEPGALFRPSGGGPGRPGVEPSDRTTKTPLAEKPAEPVKPGQKPVPKGSGDVQATVKVGAVRPTPASDATVLSPAVSPATEQKDGGKEGSADPKRAATNGDKPTGPDSPDRSTSTSRSG